jgi:hypothetical protein
LLQDGREDWIEVVVIEPLGDGEPWDIEEPEDILLTDEEMVEVPNIDLESRPCGGVAQRLKYWVGRIVGGAFGHA